MLNCKANVIFMDDADYPLAIGRQHFNTKTYKLFKKNNFKRAGEISQKLLV